MKAYGLMADLHLFNWQAFSTVDENGVNTRLAGLLSEFDRCCEETRRAGGDTVIIAGDLFHVRGSIAPSVLNPTLDVIGLRIKAGFKVVILAGNHDLEGKEANRVGSAITALEGVGCMVVNNAAYGLQALDEVIMIPWTPSIETLKEHIENARKAESDPGMVDLILHAPIDGVIKGLPNHGLSPEWLASHGFRGVYAGHYHHHKEFGGGVCSIGALAHHTWSDVQSKAGFLVVSNSGPRWFKSHLPEFVDLNETNIDDGPILAEGNYVRVKIDGALKMSEVEGARKEVLEWGAKGVVVQSIKVAKVSREGSKGVTASVSAGASLESSIAEYVKTQSFSDPEKINIECQRVLAEAGV